MAGLGVLFFEWIFAPFIEPGASGQYIAGLNLLGAAPCTAMVFVWSQLTKGDPNCRLAQVSLNDAIMVFDYWAVQGALLDRLGREHGDRLHGGPSLRNGAPSRADGAPLEQ